MSKFKVGDKVEYVGWVYNMVVYGKVSGVITDDMVYVNFNRNDDLFEILPCYEYELELVQSAKNEVIDQMNKDKELLDSLLGPTSKSNDGFVVLKPDEKWIPETYTKEYQGTFVDKKCTCGVDSIGGGLHSSWCDKS